MIDATLLRITSLEKEIQELKQGLGQSFLHQQSMQQMLKDMYNYLVIKSIINNKGNRDAIIEEMKLMNNSVPEKSFNATVLPLIDRNLEIYNKEHQKESEE